MYTEVQMAEQISVEKAFRGFRKSTKIPGKHLSDKYTGVKNTSSFEV